jgi:hypothetical protein
MGYWARIGYVSSCNGTADHDIFFYYVVFVESHFIFL